MNRLWIHFTLVIIGILLMMIIAPLFLGPFISSLQSERVANPVVEEFFQNMPPDERADLEQHIFGVVRGIILRTLIIVGVTGMIAGIILSRMLSAPLQALADGARAIAGRDMAHRVPVRGSVEMRVVAESFNEMAGQLERSEAVRRQLLADVAHELRNPIHVLRGNLQAILDGVYPLNEEEVSRLLGQTEHLAWLINDLHELSLAEVHQLPLHKQSMNLGELVKDVSATFQLLAVAQGVELRVELLGTPPVVEVDPDRVHQMLLNLLSNALRHTMAGGHIRVSVGTRAGQAEVAVSDDGAGISADQLSQVFDRFSRTDASRDRESGGAGLGLAIVKAIAETHGGNARAESAGPGRGSIFIVTLPIKGS
ncbi:MAG: HAMP domain-containing protein [Candidatus Promineofilum sp.]|nr:HAMP domain-containing protein [Promineifilum sp.]